MKLSAIKEIGKYTDNINILKASYELESYNVEKTKTLLKRLKNYSDTPIPQKIIDRVVFEYIGEIKKQKYPPTTLATLISSYTFIELLAKISEEDLERYISCCKAIKHNPDETREIFTNSDIITTYKEDHIKLCELVVKENTNKNDIDIITAAIKSGYCFASIKEIARGFKACTSSDEVVKQKMHNIKLIETIAHANIFKIEDYEVSITDLINRIIEVDSYQEIVILRYALDKPKWVSIIPFSELYPVIKYAAEKKYKEYNIIFKKHVLRHRTPQEICEMLDYINKYPKRTKYFTNKAALCSMTWEEQKTLFDEFDLESDENYLKYKNIKKAARENNNDEESIPNLYRTIVHYLTQEEYQVEVQEYLNTCNSIQEFMMGVLTNNKSKKDIRLNNTIVVHP